MPKRRRRDEDEDDEQDEDEDESEDEDDAQQVLRRLELHRLVLQHGADDDLDDGVDDDDDDDDDDGVGGGAGLDDEDVHALGLLDMAADGHLPLLYGVGAGGVGAGANLPPASATLFEGLEDPDDAAYDGDGGAAAAEEMYQAALTGLEPQTQAHNELDDGAARDAPAPDASVPVPTAAELAANHVLARARHALALNLAYQRTLQAQQAQVEHARAHIVTLQTRLKEIIVRNRVAAQQYIPFKRTAPPFFVDASGQTPPENDDTLRKRHQLQHVPMMFTWRPWVRVERLRLAAAVRMQNQKLMLHRLQAKLEQNAITREQFLRENERLKRLPSKLLEKNMEDINWDEVAQTVGSKRSAEDCLIQWLNEHPVINHATWTRAEDNKLRQVATERGARDWTAIADQVGNNRTALQCFRKYLELQHASQSGSRWRPDEDDRLRQAILLYGEKNWQQIAQHVKTRSGQQCLHRWEKTLKPSIRRGRWTAAEDQLLRDAISVHGVGAWGKIQHHVPGRTDVQCRERWCNVLSPEITNVPWTKEEDELLRTAAQQYDRRWSEVAKALAPRTDNQCWRRWKSLESQTSAYREYSFRKRKVSSPGRAGDRGKPTLARILAHPHERVKLLTQYMHENFRLGARDSVPLDDTVVRMVPPMLSTVAGFNRLVADLHDPASPLNAADPAAAVRIAATPPGVRNSLAATLTGRGFPRHDMFSLSGIEWQVLQDRFNALFFWPLLVSVVDPSS